MKHFDHVDLHWIILITTFRLIDLGLAMPKSELRLGTSVQPYGLRAPEVTLGLRITEAIDMWALGFALINMFFC